MALFVAPLAPNSPRYHNVIRVVTTLFTQLGSLQQPGYDPNWQHVDPTETMPGWRRFPPAQDWLNRNAAVAGNQNNKAMEAEFESFLDSRARAAGAPPPTPQQSEQLFNKFRDWEARNGGSADAHQNADQ
jgi:hypothetical protein